MTTAAPPASAHSAVAYAPPIRAVAYGRRSQLDAARPGKSVGDQLREAEAEISRHGWTHVTSLSDDGISASRYSRIKTRPGFEELLRLIDIGAVDTIVMAEQSRLTRDLGVLAQLIDVCGDAGVTLLVGGQAVDLADPSGMLLAGITGVVDAAESARIRKRVMRGQRGSALAGRPAGKRAYGYTRVFGPSRELVSVDIVEDEAAIVREIAARVLAGDTSKQIARDLNARGVLPPGVNPAKPHTDDASMRWFDITVRRLCLNPRYVGLRTRNGDIVGEAMWPPILSTADYEALKEKLEDPARTTAPPMAKRPGRWSHLLSSVLKCSECGGPLRRKMVGTPRVERYCCNETGCYKVTVAKDFADAFIEETVLARIEHPAFLDGLLRPDEDGGDGVAAQDELDTITARKKSLMRSVASGAFSVEDAEVAYADLDRQARQALARIKPSSADPALVAAAGPNARKHWKTLSLTAKVQLIHALMTIRVRPALSGGSRYMLDKDRFMITWAA